MSFIPRRNEEQVFLFSNFNEFRDLVDYINSQPAELEPKNEDYNSLTTFTIIYNLEYDGGLNNDNEQTFDFNNIVFNGIANDISIILPPNTSIDFKGLTWKNMYREKNYLFKNIHNTKYSTYYGNTIIKNANFFNFVVNGGGIYTAEFNGYYYVFNFINCNFSIISRDSQQSIELFNFSLLNICTINYNIDRIGVSPTVFFSDADHNALLNCTLKLTGRLLLKSSFLNSVLNGCKIIGDLQIFNDNRSYTLINANESGSLTINAGYNVIDMKIDTTKFTYSQDIYIYNYLTVINKTKITDISKLYLKDSKNYAEFQMQSEDPSASDYIYSYENLKNLGFLIATNIP